MAAGGEVHLGQGRAQLRRRLPAHGVLSTSAVAFQNLERNEQLAARCSELLGIFSRYGVRRSEGSGGPDMIYLGAGIDCQKGRYAQGIKAMEDLLQRNKIPYPAG